MADKATQDTTDTTSVSRGRFTTSLTAEVGDVLDTIAGKLSDQLRATHGIGVELSRPQVIESIARSALKTMEDAEATTPVAGGEAS